MARMNLAEAPVASEILGYRVSVRLGQGSFGTVYRGDRIRLSDITESIKTAGFGVVAIKCIERHRLSASGRDNLVSEIATLKNLDHSHIVRLVDFWWDKTHVYIITEFCGGGDLATYLIKQGALDERVVQKIAWQLSSALFYLHSLNIVHLDIKPHNILLTVIHNGDFDVKLADFGFARVLYEPTRTLVGSLLYMSPEMVRNGVADKKSDIWSFGTVLYQAFYGIPLFASKDEEELLVKLTSEDPIKLPLTPRTSDGFRDLLFHILQRDPTERLSIGAIQQHSFISTFSRDHAPVIKSERALSQLNRPLSLPLATNTPQKLIDQRTFAIANDVTRLRPDFVEIVARALHAIEVSANAEALGDWTTVYQLYTQAIELMLPIYQCMRQDATVSQQLKDNLRNLIDEWLKKGEHVKLKTSSSHEANKSSSLPVPSKNRGTKLLTVSNAKKPPPSPSPSPLPSATNNLRHDAAPSDLNRQSGIMNSLASTCMLQ